MGACVGVWQDLPFFDRINKKSFDSGRPYHCMLMLTDKCNFDCYFCAFTKQCNKNKNLTFAEWIKVIDELYDMGILYVCLTGGEITILSWFEDIYRYLISKGFVVAIKTNGSNISEKLKKLFREYPPYTTIITFYGASNEMYKRITGNAESYGCVFDAIDYFRTIKTKLDVSITITQDNLFDVPEVVNALWQRGIKTGLNTDVFPRLDGIDNGYQEYRLTPGQRVSLLMDGVDCLDKTLQKAEVLDFQLKDWVPHKCVPFGEEDCSVGICVDAKTGFTIMSDGKAQYCTNYAIKQEIDVRNGVKNAWDALCQYYGINFQSSEYCHKCEDREFCHANCPARFHLASGNSTVPDEYTCKFAFLNRIRRQPSGGMSDEKIFCP